LAENASFDVLIDKISLRTAVFAVGDDKNKQGQEAKLSLG